MYLVCNFIYKIFVMHLLLSIKCVHHFCLIIFIFIMLRIVLAMIYCLILCMFLINVFLIISFCLSICYYHEFFYSWTKESRLTFFIDLTNCQIFIFHALYSNLWVLKAKHNQAKDL